MNAKTEELVANLNDQVAALVTGDDWKAALDFQARLHKYSFNNTMLIRFQRPDATVVGGMKSLWNKVGRHVIKGEHGIAILAPLTAKRTDPDTGESKYVFTGHYRTVYVFDVKQTEGEPLTALDILHPVDLEGEAPADVAANIIEQVESYGYSYKTDPGLIGALKGYTEPTSKKVVVQASMSPLAQLKTSVHELAHIALGHVDKDFDYRSCRGVAEVEAESVAYVVCAALNLPTDDYSFAYVGGWSEGNLDLVKKTGERVARIAKGILAKFEEKEEVAA